MAACVCSAQWCSYFCHINPKWRLITCIRSLFLFVAGAIVDDGFADNQKYEKQTLILSDRLYLAFVGLMSSHLPPAALAKQEKNSHTRVRDWYAVWKFRKSIHKGRNFILSWRDYTYTQISHSDWHPIYFVLFIVCPSRHSQNAHWFKQPMFTIISICLLRAPIRIWSAAGRLFHSNPLFKQYFSNIQHFAIHNSQFAFAMRTKHFIPFATPNNCQWLVSI